MQLCSSLSILWDCLSLGLEWKLTFSSPDATAEFSKYAGILSAPLSQHHLLGFEIAQLEFHHLHYFVCSDVDWLINRTKKNHQSKSGQNFHGWVKRLRKVYFKINNWGLFILEIYVRSWWKVREKSHVRISCGSGPWCQLLKEMRKEVGLKEVRPLLTTFPEPQVCPSHGLTMVAISLLDNSSPSQPPILSCFALTPASWITLVQGQSHLWVYSVQERTWPGCPQHQIPVAPSSGRVRPTVTQAVTT